MANAVFNVPVHFDSIAVTRVNTGSLVETLEAGKNIFSSRTANNYIYTLGGKISYLYDGKINAASPISSISLTDGDNGDIIYRFTDAGITGYTIYFSILESSLFKAILDGTDTITGSIYADYLIGYDGDDAIYGGAGLDTVLGGNGNDRIYGGDGSDKLSGYEGNDKINGGAGNDRITGEAGMDLLLGNTGNDVFVYKKFSDSADGKADIIRDFTSGEDRIDVATLGIHGFSISSSASDLLHVSVMNGNTVLTNEAHRFEVILAGNHFSSLTADDFVFAASSGAVVSDGANDANYLTGTSASETLNGWGGDDTILAGSGEDKVYGGEGNDNLIGNAGNDKINGGAGDDRIVGGSGTDLLMGNTGNDVFIYKAFSDSFSGKADTIRDFISGEDKIDVAALSIHGFDALSLSVNSSGNTVLSDELHGFRIVLTGDHTVTLAESDFIFAI